MVLFAACQFLSDTFLKFITSQRKIVLEMLLQFVFLGDNLTPLQYVMFTVDT